MTLFVIFVMLIYFYFFKFVPVLFIIFFYYVKVVFGARGLEYEVIDDLCYTLIVIRKLSHILCQILAAKIPIGHRGIRTPELLILSPTL